MERRDRDRDHERDRDRHERRRHRSADRGEDLTARIEDVLNRWAEASTELQVHNSGLIQRVSDLCLNARAPGQRFVPVPSFDGSRSWAVFIAQFQSAAISNGWDEAEQGRRLLGALQGPAADLVQTLPPADYLNYERLRTRLELHYNSAQRSTVAEAELDHRKQRADESLAAYGADVMRLTRVAYPTWAEDALQTSARKSYVNGIADPDVRKAVRMSAPSTLNEAIAAALHADSVERMEPPNAKRARVAEVKCASPEPSTSSAEPTAIEADTRRVRGPPGNSHDNKMESLISELRRLADSLSGPGESKSRRDMSTVKCYKCHEYGHYQSQCTRRGRDNKGVSHRRHDGRDNRRDGRDRHDDNKGRRGKSAERGAGNH